MKIKNSKSIFLIVSTTFIIIVATIIIFDKVRKTAKSGISECVIGGCSGQLCVDKNSGNTVTTCEWKDSYSCYKLARCEKQINGKCGWTDNAEFTQCLGKDQVKFK